MNGDDSIGVFVLFLLWCSTNFAESGTPVTSAPSLLYFTLLLPVSSQKGKQIGRHTILSFYLGSANPFSDRSYFVLDTVTLSPLSNVCTSQNIQHWILSSGACVLPASLSTHQCQTLLSQSKSYKNDPCRTAGCVRRPPTNRSNTDFVMNPRSCLIIMWSTGKLDYFAYCSS